MASRINLQIALEALLGSSNVYFQPPSSQMLLYPCIVYQLSKIDTDYADNKPYSNKKRYMITVLDKNPDSSILDKVAALATSLHDRHYTANGINHDVFNIFF